MLTNIFCREKLAKEAALMKEKKTDVQEEEEGLEAYYSLPLPPPHKTTPKNPTKIIIIKVILEM